MKRTFLRTIRFFSGGLLYIIATFAQAQNISIEDGKKLFFLERSNSKGEIIGCSTCHTKDPKNSGKTRANKVLEPLAPIANSKRFTDPDKVEKWFRRNCMDVLERRCTEAEKTSFTLYMKSIK